MHARPCLSRNIFSQLINICSLPGVLNNPVVLFRHVEHLCELYKGDKKTPAWLSRAPCVYTESWNMFTLLCLELLDWCNYTLLSLKSFKLRWFSAAAALTSKVSALGSPVGTAEVDDLVAEGQSGQSKGQHPQSPWRRVSLQKEPLGSPTPVFILHVVASCMHCPQWKRCKRRAECKLMGQSDFMCGQIHFEKSKRVRKAESCLFNGERILLKSTICGWWCNRRAVYVSVCEALH